MEKVRIQDDLFEYVNRDKLDQLVIPDDMPATGGFNTLHTEVEDLMIKEISKMSENKEYYNEYLERACVLFGLAVDKERKAAHGIKPALDNLAILNDIHSYDDLSKLMKELLLRKIPVPMDFGVEVDMKDTAHHKLFVSGPGVILPDTAYYKEEMAAQKNAILGMWANMAKMILAQTGLSEEDQATYLNDTLAFDDILAKLVKSREEWSEYTKVYNPMKTSRIASLVKPLNLKYILADVFGTAPEVVIVAEPRYFKSFKEVLNENTLELYKHWAYVTGLINSCSLLSEELREIGSIYYRALSGIPAVTPITKFAYNLASEIYSEPVGLYYGEKFFGEEAKKDIVDIVYQIIDTYKDRILRNDILEDSTKQKAVLKLSTMKVKMGYPDKVRESYDKLVFDADQSLFDIVRSLGRIRAEENFAKLHKDVDHTEWLMPGHMVNACYNPTSNDITFPAAILQAPFYSIKQTRSENLGGIGAVIGHEISHAFDSNGAKCDENGNLNDWWTKEDMKKFNARIKAMVKQFDGIELPQGRVNGKFIVSENIADNGGMAVTLEIMGKTENVSYEEYFMNWARVWCTKAKPEYEQLLLRVDVHGPAVLRANMTPRNFPEWYSTFNVKKSDKMYIAPSKRVVIW